MPLDQHDLNEESEHDPDECELCVETELTVLNCECRCGNSCEKSIVEVSLRDAEREPRIAELGSPINDGFGDDIRQVRWPLNGGEHGHCVFFDSVSRLCTIYETRPLVCRHFQCDSEDGEYFRNMKDDD